MPSFDDPSDVPGRFSLAVFRVNGLLMRAGDRITRPLGQGSAQWQILGRAAYGPQTVAQMARQMGQARQSVQRVADGLERTGLITFRDLPSDRRTSQIELTPQGLQVLEAIYQRQGEWSHNLVRHVDPELLLSASSALERIAEMLEILDQKESQP